MALEFSVTTNSNPATDEAVAAVLEKPGFGTSFTDHLSRIDWTEQDGWHDARVEPYGPMQIDPASAVLHYGQEIFEGMKAYRRADGSVWLFRPDMNAARMRRSAERLALPQLENDDFVEAVKLLVAQDERWVPSGEDQSLYLRPFTFANEVFLGVRPAQRAIFMVIASPSGAYFSGGVKPVTLWLSEHYARSGKGGTGKAKSGGNYAASLLPTVEAYQKGADQVLFLDAETDTYIEESGSMNIALVTRDNRLITPDSPSILDGITRDSIEQLARDRGMAVERRQVKFAEWRDGFVSGDITEAFACGTAAVVTPIAAVLTADGVVGDRYAPAGEVTLALRKELTDIQYGRAEDRHGWNVQVTDAK